MSILSLLRFPSDSGAHSFLKEAPQIPVAPRPTGDHWGGDRAVIGLAVVLVSVAHEVTTRVGFLQDSEKLFLDPSWHTCPNTQEWKGDLPPFFLQPVRPGFDICLCHFLSWWPWANYLLSGSLKASYNTHFTGLHEVTHGKHWAPELTYWFMFVLSTILSEGHEVTKTAIESPSEFLTLS